jgi:hypothetical protein
LQGARSPVHKGVVDDVLSTSITVAASNSDPESAPTSDDPYICLFDPDVPKPRADSFDGGRGEVARRNRGGADRSPLIDPESGAGTTSSTRADREDGVWRRECC